MYFKQFYLWCPVQASYLIGSEGEAAGGGPERRPLRASSSKLSVGPKLQLVLASANNLEN